MGKNAKTPIKTGKKYYVEIDMLKAFAAFLVIFIHVIAWYKGKSAGYQYTWDLAHFSVGAFVFASGFLMANGEVRDHSFKGIAKLLWKRFVRIIVPYFIYVVVAIATMFILDGVDKTTSRITWKYLLDTLLLDGGVGMNWIPRLFMELSLLYIFSELVKPYFKYIYHLLFGVALLISVYFLFGSSDFLPRDQKLAGWFVVFMSGFFLSKNYDQYKHYAKYLLGICAIAFISTYIFLSGIGEGLSIFGNKWPPNLYFIAYNVFFTLVVFGVFRLIENWVVHNKVVMKVVKFYSHASYDMFFYHLIILSFVEHLRGDLSFFLMYPLVLVLTTAFIVIKRDVLKITI